MKVSGLSYFENPGNTHYQCEESRKVRGQYFHEHGNVIQNICKKSEETKKNAQTNQTGQTAAAAASCIPPLFSLRVEFSPGHKDKTSSAALISKQLFAFLYNYIYPFLHAKRILPHMPVPSARENNTLHAGTAKIHMVYFEGSPFNNHVIVAAATVASWSPTPTPLREA